MTIVVVLGIVAVVVVLVVVTRNSSRVKKAAKEDLKREMDSLHTPDIMELVQQEAEATGVLDIPGADDVDLPIRLRVWHRDEVVRSAATDADELRFALRDGVAPKAATDDDLALHFPGYEPSLAEDGDAVVADEPADAPDDAPEA